ncbi:MAG: ribonuclease III family protein [Candidatus Coproplasma sp.]
MDLTSVERACGYVFKNKELLKKALTLSSYDNNFNNQSLECLGDALLGFIVAEKYYNEGLSEGEITQKKQQLLSDGALTPVSKELGLDSALIRNKGDTRNKKAIPSAYEALIAGIYLDGGMEEAKKFALSTLKPLPDKTNYIGALQELLQGQGKPLPTYEQTDIGTARSPRFRSEVTLNGKNFCSEAESIASAKRLTAEKAYRYLTSGEE